jgi:hypothetical protein
MTDRELLELAAKAIGMNVLLEGIEWPRDKTGWFFCQRGGDGAPALFDRSSPMLASWAPLTDDGDALRLALKLGFKIDSNFKTGADERPGVGVWVAGDTEHYPPFWTANSKDICKDTRHTIVRAAAELGKRVQP